MLKSLIVALAIGAATSAAAPAARAATEPPSVRGTVISVAGDTLSLRERTGHVEKIDIAAARAAHHAGVLPVGGAVVVYGKRGADGVFHATSIGHTSADSKAWPPDA